MYAFIPEARKSDPNMSSVHFTALVLSLTLTLLATPTPSQGAQPPHIVVIMADDLGWADVQYRDPQFYTPNINRLQREGVTMNFSYMNQVCSPSRAAFLSGYYPFRLGMQSSVLTALSNESLPLNYRLFPQDLQDLGYSTHFVGKWHLGFCRPEMTPTYRGFDTFYGMYTGKGDHFTHISKWSGYDLQDNKGQGATRSFQADWSANGKYSTHIFTDRAVDIVKAHNSSRPLFVFLSYQAVHGPIQTPEGYLQNCSNVTTGAARKAFCAMTAAMDQGIGKVMKALEDRGFDDNLITLFTSDNGGPVSHNSSNWPLRGSKITLWEGGTRVVSLLHSKTHLPNAPYTWNGLMHAVDWGPTLLSAAGKTVTANTGGDGVNNWPSIVNQTDSARTEFIYNIDDVKNMSALRMGDYKLIRRHGGSPKEWYNPPAGVTNDRVFEVTKTGYYFFNIKEDPEELHELSENASLSHIFNTMKTKLAGYETQIVNTTDADKITAGKPKFHNMTWTSGWC
ncbi:arylsulfatase I-like [Babylonia areolata]|uniref:arylsulfatase I-like n=1 Tax=Babylonia areolata TaxID=304850 RepID=UPI003FD64202